MKRNRGVSAGTVVMLAVLALSLGGFFTVLSRLSGEGMDLTRLQVSALSLEKEDRAETDDILISSAEEKAASPVQTAAPAAAEQAREEPEEQGSLTITFGGTAAIEENIRKSCYSSDSQKYDFSLVMNLLGEAFQGDENIVFLENVLMDNAKLSETVVPTDAAEMLTEAGVSMAAAGFSRAYDREKDGILSTRNTLTINGIAPVGIRGSENDEAGTILREHGISAAVLQYTGTVTSSVRKAMAKKEVSYMLPEADPARIAEDIRQARGQGAQAVIVMLNWGKVGGKSPEKTQRALAWQIAEAGADLIIGAGSRIPQTPEWMTVAGTDGTNRKVLCVYSLGTLISDNRKHVNRMSSYLLQVTFREEGGSAVISDLAYVPTYLWRYRQDGTYYYRCLAANRTPPDGMDSDQQTNMAKAAEIAADLLKDSGIRILEQP